MTPEEIKELLKPTRKEIESLKKANLKFARLSKKKQRIKIAEDVIASLKVGRYRPASMYFELGDHSDDAEVGLDIQASDVKDSTCQVAIGIDQVGCTVCGIGSLFAAATENHDKLSLKKLFNTPDTNSFFGRPKPVRDQIVTYLKTWFDRAQLNLIENYYENPYTKDGSAYDGNKIKTTKDDKKRMIKIMENIISNDGQFDPSKGRHANTKAYQKMHACPVVTQLSHR